MLYTEKIKGFVLCSLQQAKPFSIYIGGVIYIGNRAGGKKLKLPQYFILYLSLLAPAKYDTALLFLLRHHLLWQ